MGKRIGLYFGSFNPITKAHEKIALYVINHTLIEEVEFVISPHNPHKNQNDLLDVEKRIEMVQAVCNEHKNLKVNTIELSLPLPSYTCDTLKEIKERDKENDYHIIMGFDAFMSLHKWKNYEEILKFPIILLPRDTNDNYDEFLTYKKKLDKKLNRCVAVSYLQEMNILPISSTDVRNGLKENKNVSHLLNPTVLEIIREKNLYQNGEN